MSGIDIGQAIGIIGGVPILKNALGHTVDGLKIPRHLDIGSVPSIMSAVMSGGAGALLQSPLASALSSFTGSLTQAQGAITAALPSEAASLVSAAVAQASASGSNLSALADNLVGLTSNPAMPGQLDVISHLTTVQSLGAATPVTLSMAAVLAPVHASPALTSAAALVHEITSQVVAGSITYDAAIADYQAIQASLDAVATSSTGAVSTLASSRMALCAAQSTVALFMVGDPDIAAALTVAVRADMMTTIEDAIAAHKEAIAVSASSQGDVAAALASIAAAEAADAAMLPEG